MFLSKSSKINGENQQTGTRNMQDVDLIMISPTIPSSAPTRVKHVPAPSEERQHSKPAPDI